MKIAKTIILNIIIFGLVVTSVSCEIPFISTPSKTEQITEKISKILENKWETYVKEPDNAGIPGGVAIKIISLDGEFFSSYRMGNNITENTHFRAASITKTFTAAGIYLLQQKGLLKIDDSIGSKIHGKNKTYLPQTPDYDIPNKNKITIRHLLSNRSGIFDINNKKIPTVDSPYEGKIYIDYILKKNAVHTFSIDELMGVISKNKLSAGLPGKKFNVCDTDYLILGKIIERISGKSYDEFISENFIEPNNLENTSFPFSGTDRLISEPFSEGHDFIGKEESVTATSLNVSAQVANANLVTTPKDLAIWARKLFTGETSVNEKSLETMMYRTQASPKDNIEYRPGCKFLYNLGYGYEGYIQGYSTLMVYDPVNDISIAIFSNVKNNSKPDELLVKLAGIVSEVRLALGYSEQAYW